MKFNWLSVANTLLIVAAVIYFGFFGKEKTAFFYNQKVFNEFKGKVELEEKLEQQRVSDKKLLDSLASLISAGRTDLKSLYDERNQGIYYNDQQMTAKYTEDIWRYINEGVKEYAEANGYTYVFGATGDGGLMYAKEGKDVTSEVIRFVNEKYSKK